MAFAEHLAPASLEHFVFGCPIIDQKRPMAVLGMGCFWGAERIFWKTPGITATSVGYAGGQKENVDYRLVCGGHTGHAEILTAHFDDSQISYEDIIRIFFENHDPTQGNRQGNDIGSQYRSVIMPLDEAQDEVARRLLADYNEAYLAKGFGPVTTEILPVGPIILAEEYHQQYLAKNPNGYCGIAPTGVCLKT